MWGSVWRAHIDWGDLLPHRRDTLDGLHQEGLYFALSLSLSLSLSAFSLSLTSYQSLSLTSLSPTVSIAPSPLHTAHFSSQGHLVFFKCLSRSLSLSSICFIGMFKLNNVAKKVCCIFPLCLIITHWVLQNAEMLGVPCYETLVLLLMDKGDVCLMDGTLIIWIWSLFVYCFQSGIHMKSMWMLFTYFYINLTNNTTHCESDYYVLLKNQTKKEMLCKLLCY